MSIMGLLFGMYLLVGLLIAIEGFEAHSKDDYSPEVREISLLMNHGTIKMKTVFTIFIMLFWLPAIITGLLRGVHK